MKDKLRHYGILFALFVFITIVAVLAFAKPIAYLKYIFWG